MHHRNLPHLLRAWIEPLSGNRSEKVRIVGNWKIKRWEGSRAGFEKTKHYVFVYLFSFGFPAWIGSSVYASGEDERFSHFCLKLSISLAYTDDWSRASNFLYWRRSPSSHAIDSLLIHIQSSRLTPNRVSFCRSSCSPAGHCIYYNIRKECSSTWCKNEKSGKCWTKVPRSPSSSRSRSKWPFVIWPKSSYLSIIKRHSNMTTQF